MEGSDSGENVLGLGSWWSTRRGCLQVGHISVDDSPVRGRTMVTGVAMADGEELEWADEDMTDLLFLLSSTASYYSLVRRAGPELVPPDASRSRGELFRTRPVFIRSASASGSLPFNHAPRTQAHRYRARTMTTRHTYEELAERCVRWSSPRRAHHIADSLVHLHRHPPFRSSPSRFSDSSSTLHTSVTPNQLLNRMTVGSTIVLRSIKQNLVFR